MQAVLECSSQMNELIQRYKDNGYKEVDGNGTDHIVMKRKLNVDDNRIQLYGGDSVRAEFWQYNAEIHGESIIINFSFPDVSITEKDPLDDSVKHWEYGGHSTFLEYDVIEGGGSELRSVRSKHNRSTEIILR